MDRDIWARCRTPKSFFVARSKQNSSTPLPGLTVYIYDKTDKEEKISQSKHWVYTPLFVLPLATIHNTFPQSMNQNMFVQTDCQTFFSAQHHFDSLAWTKHIILLLQGYVCQVLLSDRLTQLQKYS